MKRFMEVISAAFAIAFGILVLFGYLFGHTADGKLSLLGWIQLFIVNVAVVLAGFAVLIGVANLTLVHFNKIRTKPKTALYSVIMVCVMLGTFLLGVVSHVSQSALLTLYFNDTLNVVIKPVEASLMAILAVTLTYASIRLLRRRLNVLSVVFLGSALIVLLGTVPLPFLGDTFLNQDIQPFFTQVIATSGARGILIGLALGALTVGLRILFGADRPYGGGK
jgi:hypothetical protein